MNATTPIDSPEFLLFALGVGCTLLGMLLGRLFQSDKKD